jgi:hypothetical protein
MSDETFAIGDRVVWDEARVYGFQKAEHGEGPFTITAVKGVPEDEIEYDPVTGTGGVGHTQWVDITEDRAPRFSGVFFRKVSADGLAEPSNASEASPLGSVPGAVR